MNLPGTPLRPADFKQFHGTSVSRVERALVRRVDSPTGAQLMLRNGKGDYSGIVIPNFWPGVDAVRDYRLRLDNPPLEWRNGVQKEKYRCLSPVGRSPMLYFSPDDDPAWLTDVAMDTIIGEGEKKKLALDELGVYGLGDAAERPRWLATTIPGVWCFRGKRGRTEAADGGWQDVKGPIADLDRIEWKSRRVVLLFDANARLDSNPDVYWARHHLAKELRSRGAKVFYVDIPADAGVNGVDDLIALWGPDRVLKLIETGAYDPTAKQQARYPLTEIGNAERLVEVYGDDLRFCRQSNTWFVWDETRFAPDQIAVVERYAKQTVRELAKTAINIEDKDAREATVKFALRSDSDHGIRALLNRAAAEEGVPVLLNDLDVDRWLLNVQNGTIDLRTGELRPHSRDDLISKLAPVRFDPSAKCPRWLRFLDEVFKPHPDAANYLQRAIGYALTGDIREECLFLLYGTGRNGKGTIYRTFQVILGDYAETADFSTFIATRDDRGPCDDIANMRGRRFVTSQEAREGAPLAEALVKWLTGADMIRARNLYDRSSEWLPTHKIFLAVNHKPIIRGTDIGIWSRIKLIPFDVSFEGREDKTLKDTLQSELSGILNWAIQGCLAWQRDGLGECDSVTAATKSYRTESDQVGRFIDDRCILGNGTQGLSRLLYSEYRSWADLNGEEPSTEMRFAFSLSERGFEKTHTNKGALYAGIGLRPKK